MNYTIIKDEAALRDFIAWLPDTAAHETFYLQLLARRKYAAPDTLCKDQFRLRGFTSGKAELLSRIRQLECPLGSYLQPGGAPVPQESLALYITPNPRDLQKATKEALIRLAHLVGEPYRGHDPRALVLSEIHKARGRRIFCDLDFDGVDVAQTLQAVRAAINPDCLTVIRSRGGLHILVELARVANPFAATWFQHLTSLPGLDTAKATDIPLVGCVQGDWTPHFVALNETAGLEEFFPPTAP